jgi:oxygen-independent coproporphyrinogen-3 oxidase
VRRFQKEFNDVYGNYTKLLSFFGFMNDNGEQAVLTDSGAYWLHAFEDLFSINYVSKLWGTSKQYPWPERVVL